MTQSRKHSMAESLCNASSGVVISVAFTMWYFGVGAVRSLNITLYFTLISIIRTFFWRRLFNGWTG